MATLTPQMRIERLVIGDKPTTICGHVVQRVLNRVYRVNGVKVYTLKDAVSIVTQTDPTPAPVEQSVYPPQSKSEYMASYHKARMHPCEGGCGRLCHGAASRCRSCAARKRMQDRAVQG